MAEPETELRGASDADLSWYVEMVMRVRIALSDYGARKLTAEQALERIAHDVGYYLAPRPQ